MTQDKQGTEVTVAQDTEGRRFTLSYPGTGELAGFTEYRDHGDERVFFHTEIDEAFGGRGLAGTLVTEALIATTAAGLEIVAVCPFVKSHLERKGHEGAYRNPTPADISWIRRELGAGN
ncbi:GNAT family N-acetyltransferase [Corynebacterium sp. A21]|uniref:GNAT family N-acetyltransferase n=1 Tax=Corynebacterium sp. A21 TaxID=3457318 RepID=UPI003FD3B671